MDDSLQMVAQSVSTPYVWEPRYVMLDLLYWVAAMCVTFKMVWIIRQVSDLKFWRRWPVTVSAAALSMAVLVKALSRFHGGDPATIFDISRELALCCFLASTIAMLHRETKRF